ncbi:hypothetical protein C492_16446 [Natronococcus jeotgali DSM 18795]|uniref:Small CPxCG-related zinc finger protein n=1 Tax=Natronococcus jeotgali DSM 18795 TaxID=1227498 RepID=L9WYH8_9EURY|nr:hypothetical protein C492_16446 [Natronococcus jeotgali DSM 18795]
MDVGCPECDGTVRASVPPGPGRSDGQGRGHLRGTETRCRNCGHELEFYYY